MQVNPINNSYSYSNNSNSVAFKKVVKNKIPANLLRDNKYLLLVSGPSGVGKDTVMNMVIDKFNKIVTHTTRPMRPGEVNGKSYFFTTVEKFVEGIKNNEFVEYIEGFSGKYYGTKKETIKNAMDGKKPGLLIVDVDGAKNIRENLKDDPEINVVSIFFKQPSKRVLKERLRRRGTETSDSLTERLNRAKYEMRHASKYDAVIKFKTPEEGVKDLLGMLKI